MTNKRYLTLAVICAVISLAIPAPVDKNDQCGVSDFSEDHAGKRIFNDAIVPEGKYPWLAHISVVTQGGVYPCTATIISRKYILTAGHCVCSTTVMVPQPCTPIAPHQFTVVVGSVDAHKGQQLKVKRTLYHEKYLNPSKHFVGISHDIGLLELEEPLNFTKNIRRICLSGKYRTSDPRENVIAGWGVMYPAYPVLGESIARVVDNGLCQQMYSDYDSDAICLEQRNSAIIFPDGGDGGGPAFLKENGRWTEIGIISYGTYVYARVSYFCDWIAEKTNYEVKCDS